MKTRYYFPILAALILAFAALGFAQDTYYDDSGIEHVPTPFRFESTPTVQPVPDTNAVANAGVYYNDSGIQQVPTSQFASIPSYHAGRMGNLKLNAAVKLGGVVLQPGDYHVRHINNGHTHYVEFWKTVASNVVLDGASPWTEEVVARVKCTREPQSTVVARTELQPKTAGTTARLEIRGEKAVHLF